jgi:hypothetical protein
LKSCNVEAYPAFGCRVDELAREYHDTHDPAVIEEIYEQTAKGDGTLKVPASACYENPRLIELAILLGPILFS